MNYLFTFLCIVVLTSCQKNNTEELLKQRKLTESLRRAQSDYEKNFRFSKKAEVKRGQGLFQAMGQLGIDTTIALHLINALRDEVEFSKLKVGDRLEGIYNHQNKLVGFSFSQNLAQKHQLDLFEGNWKYEFIEEETIWRPRLVEGSLKRGETLNSSLGSPGHVLFHGRANCRYFNV